MSNDMSNNMSNDKNNNIDNNSLIKRIEEGEHLSHEEWTTLFDTYTEENRIYAAKRARALADKIYGKDVFIRGIV